MSAFSVGAEASTLEEDGSRTPSTGPTSSAPATFVKWIPGEALTFYAAILGLGAAQVPLTGKESAQETLERIEASSVQWFLVGASLAAALVVIGALTEKREDPATKVAANSIGVRVALALASFVIWTTALPGSWSYGWHFVRDMGAAYALLLVPVAAIFAGVAEYLTKRYKL